MSKGKHQLAKSKNPQIERFLSQTSSRRFKQLGDWKKTINLGHNPGDTLAITDTPSDHFQQYIHSTPVLKQHVDLILRGERITLVANRRTRVNNHHAIGKLVQESRSAIDNLVDADFETQFRYLLLNTSEDGLRARLNEAMTLLTMPTYNDELMPIEYFIEKYLPILMCSLADMCFAIRLLENQPQAKSLLVTPMEYNDIFNCLNFITIIASHMKSVHLEQTHQTKAHNSAFALYQISCEIILPFFENRFWMVKATDHKASKFNIEPIDLKFEPAAMRIRYARCYLDFGQFKAAQKICSSFTKRYLPAIQQAPHACQQLLLKNASHYRQLHRQDNRQWRLCESRNSQSHMDDSQDNLMALNAQIYKTWLSLELAGQRPNLERAVCYLELIEQMTDSQHHLVTHAKGYTKLTNLTAYYQQIAHLFENMGAANKAVAYFTKALEKLRKAQNVIEQLDRDNQKAGKVIPLPNLQSDIVSTQKKLKGLKGRAFVSLENSWHELHMTFSSLKGVQFDREYGNVNIHCVDTVALLAYQKQLKQTDILFACDQSQLEITLRLGYCLSAQQLIRIFHRAEQDLAHKKNLAAVAARNRELSSASKSSDEQSVDTHRDVELSTAKSLHKRKPSKPKKSKKGKQTQSIKQTAALVSSKPERQLISWGNDLPDYCEEGNVFPIPNTHTTNAPIPKGVFFGYVPDHVRHTLNKLTKGQGDILYKRFVDQLARGAFSRKKKPQGLRTVCGEIGHDPSNEYLFKINIGREDYRLYGRKVGTIMVDGEPKVLIAFDQPVSHKEELNNKIDIVPEQPDQQRQQDDFLMQM